MNHPDNDRPATDDDARGHESDADRASKVPKRPEETDEAGNALNDTGQDNHQRKPADEK